VSLETFHKVLWLELSGIKSHEKGRSVDIQRSVTGPQHACRIF